MGFFTIPDRIRTLTLSSSDLLIYETRDSFTEHGLAAKHNVLISCQGDILPGTSFLREQGLIAHDYLCSVFPLFAAAGFAGELPVFIKKVIGAFDLVRCLYPDGDFGKEMAAYVKDGNTCAIISRLDRLIYDVDGVQYFDLYDYAYSVLFNINACLADKNAKDTADRLKGSIVEITARIKPDIVPQLVQQQDALYGIEQRNARKKGGDMTPLGRCHAACDIWLQAKNDTARIEGRKPDSNAELARQWIKKVKADPVGLEAPRNNNGSYEYPSQKQVETKWIPSYIKSNSSNIR